MIRITSGIFKGRRIFTGNALRARPAMSIIRESVFNILRSYVDMKGLNVCDLFCGSGSLTFEAISRGAGYSCLVDVDPANLKLVKRTAASFGIEHQINPICCDMHRLIPADRKYAIAFVDPPYKEPELIYVSLRALRERGWCDADSIIVLRIRKGEQFTVPQEYSLLDQRLYCGSVVLFLTLAQE